MCVQEYMGNMGTEIWQMRAQREAWVHISGKCAMLRNMNVGLKEKSGYAQMRQNM